MRNIWLVWVWLVALLFLNVSARAQSLTPIDYNDPNDPYYQITDASTVDAGTSTEPVTELKIDEARKNFQEAYSFQTEKLSLPGVHLPSDSSQPQIESHPFANAFGIGPYVIAQVLFKLWDIVLEGKPVVNVEVKNASALPVMANYHWSMLTGWQPERVVKSTLVIKNLLGQKPITMDTYIKLMFGGSIQGRGQYIASARVVPNNVKVLWGYNLDVSVNVPSVVNVSGRDDDPNAQITLEVTYKIQSKVHNWVIKKSEITDVYKLQGDGQFWNQKTADVYFEGVYHEPAPPLPSPTPTPEPVLPTDPLPTDPNTDDPFGNRATPTPTPKPAATPKPTVKPTSTPKPTPTPKPAATSARKPT